MALLSTRRLIDRSLSGALLFACVALAANAAASCAGDDPTPSAVGSPDAAVDAPSGIVPTDAAISDAPVIFREAATSDAGPRPVACADAACAVALQPSQNDSFCALLHDGTVACWGDNALGQLGRGADAGSLIGATPQRVALLHDITYLGHACAVDKDGATWCWGTGPHLQDPAVSTTTDPAPVKLPLPKATMADVSTLFDVAVGCAVVETGVACWGTNMYGQVAVPEAGTDPAALFAPQVKEIGAGAPVTGLFVGNATFLLRADGVALSWGVNPPLGRVSSLIPDPYPRAIMLDGVSSIDTIQENACAVARGIAYCWGGSNLQSSALNRPLPEPIVIPEPVVRIATTYGKGNTYDPQRGCAVGVSGAVFCWGSNISGQAGDGTKNYAITTVKVVGLPALAVDVKTTPRTTCALLVNGKVHCWGDDFYGQLGYGKNKAPSLAPVEVLLP